MLTEAVAFGPADGDQPMSGKPPCVVCVVELRPLAGDADDIVLSVDLTGWWFPSEDGFEHSKPAVFRLDAPADGAELRRCFMRWPAGTVLEVPVADGRRAVVKGPEVTLTVSPMKVIVG